MHHIYGRRQQPLSANLKRNEKLSIFCILNLDDSMISQVTKSHSCDYHEALPPERIAGFFEKPALDGRSYRVIKLKNRLEALLIHDPHTERVSGALDVNVGSFSDPVDIPGIAHAVEHLLFMGTKKVSSGRPIGSAIASDAKVFSPFA